MAIFIAGTTMATGYKQSIGLSVGSLNGITYKYFFTDKLALQNDLVVGFQATTATVAYSFKAEGESAVKEREHADHTTISTVEFVYNPNVLYHLSLGSTGLDLVVGGGLSIGFGKPYQCDYREDGKHYVSSGKEIWSYDEETGAVKMGGKFGINAFAGMEYNLTNAPVTFAFDFRPGYGVLFKTQHNDSDEEIKWKAKTSLNTFDWRLSVSMRYCF
ncbi:MAG TPA: hypothetical protein DIW30_03760 [Bacteroidales bacterium]|nr:hypothetical protein [Bacteroidales bacterium]